MRVNCIEFFSSKNCKVRVKCSVNEYEVQYTIISPDFGVSDFIGNLCAKNSTGHIQSERT